MTHGPRAGRLVTVILFASLLGLLSTAQAETRTIVYTESTDFDSGTKSQPDPADGNYGVETATDNPAVADGTAQLASMMGDSFTLDDSDANTFKWDTLAICQTDQFRDGYTPDTLIKDISGGALQLGGQDADLQLYNGVVGDATVRGLADSTFSAQVRVSHVSSPTASSGRFQFLSLTPTLGATCWNAVPEAHGGWVYIWLNDPTGMQVGAFVVSATTPFPLVQCGTYTTPGIGNAVWLRVTHDNASGITFSYSANGQTWTQDETNCTNTGGGFGHISMRVVVPVNATVARFTFDEFSITTGREATFRTTGSWESPSIPIEEGGGITSIALTYSRLSTTYYIDRIELLASGSIREAWDDNIVSGTATTLVPAASISGQMSVRVTLAGDGGASPTPGDGSPILESVTLTYETGGGGIVTPPPPPPGDAFVFITCSFRWPANVVSCEADERLQRDLVAIRTWTVDGEIRQRSEDPNGSHIDIATGIPWWLPATYRAEIAYDVQLISGTVIAASPLLFSADTLWLWVLYGALGLVAIAAAGSRLRTRRPRNHPRPRRSEE